MTFALAPDPDWHGAARELVGGLCALEGTEGRIRLLESVCVGLGDALYPAFLQILHAIERDGEPAAREVVARTLVDCLLSGRLPSGRLPAWGAASLPTESPFGQVRTLGPIEYLCAWRGQPSSLPALPDERFGIVLASLVALVDSHPPAARLYARKLLGDAEDPLDGSLAGRTREGLGELARRWAAGASPEEACTAFLGAIEDGGGLLENLARAGRPDALR